MIGTSKNSENLESLTKNQQICRNRGFHDEREFIDPQSGGFTRCVTCGYEVDREESEGW